MHGITYLAYPAPLHSAGRKIETVKGSKYEVKKLFPLWQMAVILQV